MKNKLFSIFTALAMVLGILVSPFTSAHAADEENAAATVDKTTNIYLHKLLMTSQELKDWDSKAIEEKGYDATQDVKQFLIKVTVLMISKVYSLLLKTVKENTLEKMVRF